VSTNPRASRAHSRSSQAFAPLRRPDWRHNGGNFTTLPQYFKERGYITKGIGKIFHWGVASGRGYPAASGMAWDDVYCPNNATCDLYQGEYDAKYSWTEEYFVPDGVRDDVFGDAVQPVPEEGKHGTKAKPLADMLSLAHAKETLKKIQYARSHKKDERPFFLAVGWIKPHLPWRFPERFLDYYKDVGNLPLPPTWDSLPENLPVQAYYKSSETRQWRDVEDLKLDYRRFQNGSFLPNGLEGLFMPAAKIRHLRRGYYASVSYVDWCVGQLLDEAKNVDRHDDTVVVFMSDHGYQLGEHGLWDKETNFAVATNAPFMIRVPGKPRTVSNMLAQGVDLFPTIVEAALGLSMPRCPKDSSKKWACTEGVSLLPLFNKPTEPVNVAAFSVHPSYWKPPKLTGKARRNESLVAFDGNPKLKDRRSPCLGSMRLKLGEEAEQPEQVRASCVMGSSMVTDVDGHEIRYAEWATYAGPESNWKPIWTDSYAVELYNHTSDPQESENLAIVPQFGPPSESSIRHFSFLRAKDLVKTLQQRLHAQVASYKDFKKMERKAERREKKDKAKVDAEERQRQKDAKKAEQSRWAHAKEAKRALEEKTAREKEREAEQRGEEERTEEEARHLRELDGPEEDAKEDTEETTNEDSTEEAPVEEPRAPSLGSEAPPVKVDLSCEAVSGEGTVRGNMTKWCQRNCAFTPPNCPATLCVCGSATATAQQESDTATAQQGTSTVTAAPEAGLPTPGSEPDDQIARAEQEERAAASDWAAQIAAAEDGDVGDRMVRGQEAAKGALEEASQRAEDTRKAAKEAAEAAWNEAEARAGADKIWKDEVQEDRKQREEERAQKERADWEAARDAVAQTWNAPPEEAAALQPLRSLLLSTRL
jgi:arylsulfatase A-like enzyme